MGAMRNDWETRGICAKGSRELVFGALRRWRLSKVYTVRRLLDMPVTGSQRADEGFYTAAGITDGGVLSLDW